MSFVIDTPEGIEYVQFLARRGALKLEMQGLKRRGRSAYSIIKEVYGVRGSREKILSWMDAIVEEVSHQMEK